MERLSNRKTSNERRQNTNLPEKLKKNLFCSKRWFWFYFVGMGKRILDAPKDETEKPLAGSEGLFHFLLTMHAPSLTFALYYHAVVF